MLILSIHVTFDSTSRLLIGRKGQGFIAWLLSYIVISKFIMKSEMGVKVRNFSSFLLFSESLEGNDQWSQCRVVKF